MKRSIAVTIALIAVLSAQCLADMKREVNIWVARDVAPGPKVRLDLNTRNVPAVRMAAYRISDINLLINRQEDPKPVAPSSAPAKQWTVSMLRPKEAANPAQRDIYRSRQVNLPPLPPGAYILVARGGDLEDHAIVNVTNLAIVSKRSGSRILTWVTDAVTGRVVRGAKVTLYGPATKTTYTPVKTSTTGADGVSTFEAAPKGDQAIVVSRAGDLAVVPSAKSTDDGALVSHFQTDRPIYRPGQTVLYKAILRRTQGRGYTPVANKPCKVEIRDRDDNVVDRSDVTSNSIGTLSGQFDIPSEAAIGAYSIVVSLSKDESVYATFSVAEYRKPEYEVKVRPLEKRYLSGQEIAFEVLAKYYFGAPLQQATVSYRVRRSSMDYWGGGAAWWSSDDGNLYARDTYASNDFVAEGTVATDDSGKVTIPIKTKPDTPDSSYSVSVTVEDNARRQVEGSSSVPVYAAAIRLGLRTDVISAPLGSNIPVSLSVTDLDGKPVAAKVTLLTEGQVWDKKAKCYKTKSFGTTTVDVPATGRATAKVPAKTEGDLYITATAFDTTGHKTRDSIYVWVADVSAKTEKEEPNREPSVSIKLDRESYSPGDTATAWVSTSTLDRPVLVTAEGRDIWKYEVIPAGVKTGKFALKTSLEMSPNAFIEATQWTHSYDVSAGVTVPIPDKSRRLEVTVEPERKNYRPGEPAEYLVQTKDQSGKPVSAEVAVSVVDEAIYALRADNTPDLLTRFWASRPNSVVTERSAPEEVSGGAYQRVNSLAPVRQRFVDTAYWNAHLMTGDDGTAKVSFEVPGNLTTWRATARAITSDTRVGSGAATVQASRPVMLRLATPRQFVKGDRLTLIGTVTNRTDAPHEFETAISAVGLKIEGETTKKVQVPANSQGTVEWAVVADTLPDTGVASITARTLATDAAPDQGDDLSDALQANVKVVPDGIEQRIAEGGSMSQEKTVTLDLPTDRIEPASKMAITIHSGLPEVVQSMAEEVIGWGRCGSLGAADQLLAIGLSGPDPKNTREALAAVYSAQGSHNGGWGWWGDSADPEVTASVLTDLQRARGLGIDVPDRVIVRGADSAAGLFRQENLWERAALLASAATLANNKDSAAMLAKVHDKGKPLSPFAKLVLAEAHIWAGKADWATEAAGDALANAVVGPEVAYVPAGDHPGWEATTVETTAQALLTIVRLNIQNDLQPKLAQWLVAENSRCWLSQHEMVVSAFALKRYAEEHPQSATLGSVQVSVNGTPIPSEEKLGVVRASVPSGLLKDSNTITIKRGQPGEVFCSVEARVFRPATDETKEGIRVLRRYEVRNAAGLWDETTGAVKAGEAVRCTVIVWPNDRPDAIRVVEPMPSGFEFVDSDYSGYYNREEVRDGAVIHYFTAKSRPSFFRYYLRTESEGTVNALPAMAEAIRRPTVRGNSQLITVKISK